MTVIIIITHILKVLNKGYTWLICQIAMNYHGQFIKIIMIGVVDPSNYY